MNKFKLKTICRIKCYTNECKLKTNKYRPLVKETKDAPSITKDKFTSKHKPQGMQGKIGSEFHAH